MIKCSGITQAGTACKGTPIDGSQWCYVHHPDHAEKVLSGEVERGVGAVVGQLLNGARACVRDGLAAREQEELIARMEQLEEALEAKESRYGA